ncbi:unnamed protein product, partial [Brachionus calyciflorus]
LEQRKMNKGEAATNNNSGSSSDNNRERVPKKESMDHYLKNDVS